MLLGTSVACPAKIQHHGDGKHGRRICAYQLLVLNYAAMTSSQHLQSAALLLKVTLPRLLSCVTGSCPYHLRRAIPSMHRACFQQRLQAGAIMKVLFMVLLVVVASPAGTEMGQCSAGLTQALAESPTHVCSCRPVGWYRTMAATSQTAPYVSLT